jgi:hypothetical protein
VRRLVAVVVSALVACAGTTMRAPDGASAFRVDSGTVTSPAGGVRHRVLHLGEGPWVVQVLEVSLDRCTGLEAVKGFAGAIGRERTSVLLERLADSVRVLGGVNADFFLFTPPGVPTNAHVQRGVVTAGPNAQPVLAIDRDGRPWLGPLSVRGEAMLGGRMHPIAAWNRVSDAGLALFDRSWGPVLDTASGVLEVLLTPDAERRVVRVDSSVAGMELPPGSVALVAGRRAPSGLHTAIAALRPGDQVDVHVELSPSHPLHAVGGRPIVVEGGAITRAALDTNAFAVTRHPRTAVGLDAGGRRALLVVVDGRRPAWSVGMSLAELARLMLQLGAHDALNLDGGGSSALVVARDGRLVVANRPSDLQGERAVANALAVVRRC